MKLNLVIFTILLSKRIKIKSKLLPQQNSSMPSSTIKYTPTNSACTKEVNNSLHIIITNCRVLKTQPGIPKLQPNTTAHVFPISD